MKNFISLLILVFALSSCATSKIKSTENKDVQPDTTISSKYFYDNILKKSDFDVLKITSKIDIQNIPNINATIYIENNQKVWMNMSAFFINVARGVATPQGIKAYEKIDKTYIDSDFTYLNKLLNINFLDYSSLQNLLLGKVFIPINEKDFSITQSSENYILKSIKNQKIVVDGKTNEYAIELLFSKNFDLEKVSLVNPNNSDQLLLSYENWTNLNGLRLPQSVKINIKEKKSRQILIENTKFEFSKMETPYTIPNNYKKREL